MASALYPQRPPSESLFDRYGFSPHSLKHEWDQQQRSGSRMCGLLIDEFTIKAQAVEYEESLDFMAYESELSDQWRARQVL